MKTKHLTKLGFCFALLCVFFFTVLARPDSSYAASKVKLNREQLTFCEKETQTLKVLGTSKKVTWSSSNKKVATVSSSGKVKALKPGTATITAKVNGKKLTCKTTIYEMIGTYYCVWNVNWDPSPANKKLTETQAAEVRYAINLLFDRSYIVTKIVNGVKPASTFVAMGIMEPDGSQFYKHAGPKKAGYYPASPQKSAAMKILKKYYTVSNGKVTNFPEIDYAYNGEGTSHWEIAQSMQARLKDVGIKMNIKAYVWNDYTNNIIAKGKFSLARAGWIADLNDANNFLELNVPGNEQNWCKLGLGKHASKAVYSVKLKGIGKYKNLKGTWKQTYQKLISYIRKEKNAEVRNQLLHKAEDLLMETGCICPLYYYTK